MSAWRPGWYGYDPESPDHMAWGPEDSPEAARIYPGTEDPPKRVLVFHIDESEDDDG